MSESTTLEGTVAGSERRNGWRVVLWIVQIVLGAFFVMGGGSKLAGAPEAVALFDEIGIGQWFRYLTGLLEVGGAILLVVPRTAAFAALLLAVVMVGAVFTHLFVVGGSPMMAAAFLAALLLVWWGRR